MGEKFESSHTSEDDFLLSIDEDNGVQKPLRSKAYKRAHIAILYFTNVVTLIVMYVLQIRGYVIKKDLSLGGVYSPARPAVEYMIHRFESAFYNQTEYMGYPTPELDARWSNLTKCISPFRLDGISEISNSEAALLFEPTMSNLDNSSEHLIILDIFHQIHCLNSIRQSFYPNYYPIEREYYANGTERKDTMTYKHWDHCIDSIRQSLMCSGDITPVVYHIDPRGTGVFPKLQGTHVCRNYDMILAWAKEHDGSNSRFLFEEGDALLDIYRTDPQGFLEKGGSE